MFGRPLSDFYHQQSPRSTCSFWSKEEGRRFQENQLNKILGQKKSLICLVIFYHNFRGHWSQNPPVFHYFHENVHIIHTHKHNYYQLLIFYNRLRSIMWFFHLVLPLKMNNKSYHLSDTYLLWSLHRTMSFFLYAWFRQRNGRSIIQHKYTSLAVSFLPVDKSDLITLFQ